MTTTRQLGHVALVITAWLLAIATLCYLLPWAVAVTRRHQVLAVGLVNLLLGWTLLGWVVALVWAVTDRGPHARGDERIL